MDTAPRLSWLLLPDPVVWLTSMKTLPPTVVDASAKVVAASLRSRSVPPFKASAEFWIELTLPSCRTPDAAERVVAPE